MRDDHNIKRWLTAPDDEVGPACMNVPVPPTIATDDAFREPYQQGYRHALSDVRAALTAQGEPAPTPDEISRDISSGLRRWAAKNKAQGKPRAERAEADAATLREQVREWAIYCFTRHGNDAHLYNGLAELAALTSGGDTKPPARGLRELYENPEFRARYDAELEKARRDLALPAAEGLLRVLSEYDLRDQIHGLEPWVQDAVEVAIRALRAVSEGRR